MHRRKIVNGLPFLQLFSSHLTLATITRAHAFTQQARGYRARRWPAHRGWYSGSCPTCYTVYGSAQPFKKYSHTRQWKSFRAICFSIFQRDRVTEQKTFVFLLDRSCHSWMYKLCILYGARQTLEFTWISLPLNLKSKSITTIYWTVCQHRQSGGASLAFSPQHFVQR